MPPAPEQSRVGGRLGPASADTHCALDSLPSGFWGHGDKLPGRVCSLVDDRSNYEVTAWLPVCGIRGTARGCGAGLAGRRESEEGVTGEAQRAERSFGETPTDRGGCCRQKGEAGHRLAVSKQGTEGFQVAGAGTAGGQEGGRSKRLGLCWQRRCWVEHSEPHLWTVRSPGKRGDS